MLFALAWDHAPGWEQRIFLSAVRQAVSRYEGAVYTNLRNKLYAGKSERQGAYAAVP